MAQQPLVIILAGPNGAGKTTFARDYLVGQPFINADDIASDINPDNVSKAKMPSGRIAVTKIKEEILNRNSFAFETTFAGKRYPKAIPEWKAAGFRVVLYYLWIPDIATAIRRVRERVRSGGHDIPLKDIERRYWRGLENLFQCANVVDNCVMINNARSKPEIMWRTEEV